MAVTFTKVSLPNGWLGNMAPYSVEYKGKVWKTTEALFQALRFEREDGANADLIALIWREKSPMGAKMVAKKNKDRMVIVPLSVDDLKNMEMVLRLKLEQHPELKDMLLATGEEVIIEDVTARADVKSNNLLWGAAQLPDGDWVGKNYLGKLWMKIRKEIREG